MAREIEVKLGPIEPEPVRQRLLRLAGPLVGSGLEVNCIFDTPDRSLLNADCGLRIREFEPTGPSSGPGPPARRAWLTYKGPRRPGQPKVREELETAVDNPASLAEILRQLGYRQVVVYQKRRQTWHLGGCEVALDELPGLGWWVEIEGPDEAAVMHVRQRLGLSGLEPVTQTYVELAVAHGVVDSEGCHHLTFFQGS